jgi:hypothetical protein
LIFDLRNINFNDEETLKINFDNEKYYFNLEMMLNLFLDFRNINEKYYPNLRMMSNLFLDLRNFNFNDEQTLNLNFDNEKYDFI